MASKHEAYYNSIAELTKKVNIYQNKFEKANNRVKAYQKNLNYISNERASLTKDVYELITTMNNLEREIGGSPSKKKLVRKTIFLYLAAYIVQEEDGILILMVQPNSI